MTTKKFKVMSVNANTNSFGLTWFIAVARDKTVFQAASLPLNLPKKGQFLEVDVGENNVLDPTKKGWELFELMINCSDEVVREVWDE